MLIPNTRVFVAKWNQRIQDGTLRASHMEVAMDEEFRQDLSEQIPKLKKLSRSLATVAEIAGIEPAAKKQAAKQDAE